MSAVNKILLTIILNLISILCMGTDLKAQYSVIRKMNNMAIDFLSSNRAPKGLNTIIIYDSSANGVFKDTQFVFWGTDFCLIPRYKSNLSYELYFDSNDRITTRLIIDSNKHVLFYENFEYFEKYQLRKIIYLTGFEHRLDSIDTSNWIIKQYIAYNRFDGDAQRFAHIQTLHKDSIYPSLIEFSYDTTGLCTLETEKDTRNNISRRIYSEYLQFNDTTELKYYIINKGHKIYTKSITCVNSQVRVLIEYLIGIVHYYEYDDAGQVIKEITIYEGNRRKVYKHFLYGRNQ